MIRQLVFVCAFSLISNIAFSQVSPSIPPVFGAFKAQGYLECESGPGLSETDSEIAASCELAHETIEARLRASFGTCYGGAQPAYIEDGCVPLGTMLSPSARIAEAPADPMAVGQTDGCRWTVRLIFTFATGKRAGARASGATYCEAYRAAWAAICRMTTQPKYGPVCPGTGNCKVTAPKCCCCAQHVSAAHCNSRPGCRMWFRRR